MLVSDHFFHIEGVAAALAIVAFTWSVIRYIVKAANVFNNTSSMVRYLYENHIPHIENAVRSICIKLHIDYDEAPPPPMPV